MLQYDRIDVSEEIDISKTSKPKECMICHYWYFKEVGYKFHAVSMMAYELKLIAILNAKGVDSRCPLRSISKNDVVDRLNNSVLENKGVL